MVGRAPLPALILRRAHLLRDCADPRLPRVWRLPQVLVWLVVRVSARVGEEPGGGTPAREELGGGRNLEAPLSAAEPEQEAEQEEQAD